jgi:hypothetical protein
MNSGNGNIESDTQERVLLIVGSAKRPRSTSESLGTFLCQRLAERGWETEKLLLHRVFRAKQGEDKLLAAVDRADLIVLAFPLYIDTLPYLAVRALEMIAAHRQETEVRRPQRLLAIGNCGFPEAQHVDTALAICRQFAREVGWQWAGGLALGGGESLHGQPLEEAGGKVRHVAEALERTAEALAAGEGVPSAAVSKMDRAMVPAWMYMLLGGLGWRLRARKHGVHGQIHARPLLD